jgi:tetratricopeptide (TPR) repeat protein
MKYFSGMLLFFIGVIPCAAASVDSLSNILSEQEGAERISILVQLFDLEQDSALARSYVDESLSLLSSSIADSMKVDVLLAVGKWYQERGSFEHSDRYFDRAVQGARDNSSILAYVHLSLGNSIEQRPDHVAAMSHFKADWALRVKLGQLKEESRALNNIAISYWYQEELDSAMYYLRQTIPIDAITHDTSSMAAVSNTLGMLCTSRGQLQLAIEYYQVALQLSLTVDDKQNIPIMKRNLAGVYNRAGVYDEALRYALEAVPYFEETNQQKPLAYTHNTIGNVYRSGMK